MRKDSTLCSSFNSKDFSDREQVHRKLHHFSAVGPHGTINTGSILSLFPALFPLPSSAGKSSINYNLPKRIKRR